MKYNTNIFELFKTAYQKDRDFIKDWMVSWKLQDIRTKRKVKYQDSLPQNFYEYKGAGDIIEWMNWGKAEKPAYFPKHQINPLIAKSLAFDKKMLAQNNLDYDFNHYEKGIGRTNAQDYILANFYPMRGPEKGRKVLDFGSGYGRQANLWNQMEDEAYTHVSMDAIPQSYCLQHFYYANFDRPFYDYITDESFALTDDSEGIYHLPTWRFDLIPDNYFDKILVVQVLQELNEELVKYVLGQFHRILKSTGCLYIRDHSNSWRPAHKINIEKYLMENGFTLEYKMHAVDKKEIHGIPRIWRKTNPEVAKQEKIASRQRLNEVREYIDAATGGKLKEIIKSIKR